MKPDVGVYAQERRAQGRSEAAVPPAPDLSVVICSLNGAAGVARCLRALAEQTAAPLMEIVVVDDGSTDGTGDVAREHGAVVIRHATNRGLAAARNSGLHAAAAPVVAFLDDDCEPDPDWARRLLAGYEDDVQGVGGAIEPDTPRGFMAGYLRRHNPLQPLELNLAVSENVVRRFWLYLRRQWAGPQRHDRRDVYSLTGANMSFRRPALMELGGFDERFRFGGEEGDLCKRLGLAFPDGRLVYLPDAQVVHHFAPSLADTLRRSRAYGRGSARLYRKWPTVAPTFFPWPAAVLALLVASIWFPVLLAAAFAAPLLFYPQGLRAAVVTRRPSCLLDAYVQLLQEAMGDVGFAQGLWLFRRFVPECSAPLDDGEPAAPPKALVLPGWLDRLPVAGPLVRRAFAGRAGRWLAADAGPFVATSLAALALLAGLVWVRGVWAAELAMVPLLLVVPGVVLLRAMRVPGRAVASFPVYVPCASLAVLLGSGLATDLVGPLVGVAAPLRPAPLLIGLEIICLGLLARSASAPRSTSIPWRSLPSARCALPLLLPLVAAAGALRLNSGHGDRVAVAALLIWVAMVLAALVFARRLGKSLLAFAVYAAGLAMLWSFSLRGSLFYGFDISDEYYFLHQAVLTGIWHPSNSGNAFSAMLSVTVMPAELHELAGVPTSLVFQAVYPMITALFPVGVFYLARRILSDRWAFAAAAFIPTQAVFAQELPAIARQEIALVLFTALVAALLDTRLSRRVQVPLAVLFTLAMVVSHYTTTYIAIPLIGFAFLMQWGASWFRPLPRMSVAFAGVFLAAAAGAFLWYGPVTHSASNVSVFVSTAESQGFNFLPNTRDGGSLISDYLEGNTQSPLTARQYQTLVASEYATSYPFVAPLPDAGQARYALAGASPPEPPVTWALGYTVLGDGQVIAQQLIYLLAFAGALMLLLRRNVPVIGRQLGLLTFATLLFLVGIRLSGTLAIFYNAERAFLQAMVFLNIAVFWCLQELARYRRVAAGGVAAAAGAVLFLAFAGGSGLGGAVLGGGTATNLANSGDDFQQFYVTPPELTAASWLGRQARPGELVYADRYAQLPLIAQTGLSNGLLGDVTPQTLDRHAWVYASRTNIVDGVARADYGDHSVTYAFPKRFLDANYNLVYTDGSSEVFHG
jgi:GT2 family glycosyltransferase